MSTQEWQREFVFEAAGPPKCPRPLCTMGNFSSKDSHGFSGAHQETFCTPPTSPITDVPDVSHTSTNQLAPTIPVPPAPHLLPSGPKSKPSTILATSKPPPDWKPPPPNRTNPCPNKNKPGNATTPRRQDSVERNGGLTSSTPRTQVSLGKMVPVSPAKSLSLSSVSSSAWGEPDSGLSHSLAQGHGVAEDHGVDMEQLWQECRTTLGSSAGPLTAVNPTELLRCLLTEVKSLRSALQTERAEWLQFQSDLQVAVAVADRLRAEAEEALTALRTAHKEVERELGAAQQRQKEADTQLLTLRGELSESRQRCATLAQAQSKLEAQAPSRAQERPSAETTCDIQEQPQKVREQSLYRLGQDKTDAVCRRDGTNSVVLPEARMDSMGVAKRYLRNVTNEDRTGEESQTSDPQRVLTTERSRSLCRLPASSDPPAAQNGTSQSNIGTTTDCTNKKKTQPRGLTSVDWQESWSSTHIGKREDSLNKYNSALTELPPTKSQDGFNLLVRRHGGSKRNSLLRWCQSRAQGYKNIDITNFSSSWVDGLAFCAVYHTYLPSHIPYVTLSPESKRENLNLAFKTGENVGIAQSLTVEEMLRPGGPDWQRVLSYVESMYRHFEM